MSEVYRGCLIIHSETGPGRLIRTPVFNVGGGRGGGAGGGGTGLTGIRQDRWDT